MMHYLLRFIERIKQDIIIQHFFCVLMGMVLFFLLTSHLDEIFTVWQLSDEAAYLANAELFCGNIWKSIYEIQSYYGFGYSILIIPICIIAKSGLELIKGAIVVNILLTCMTYYLLYYVITVILEIKNRYIATFFSFFFCCASYVYCSSLQVIAESLVIVLSILSGVLLYKILVEDNVFYHIMIGILQAYMFSVHTRLVVISAVLMVCYLLFYVIKKKKDSIANAAIMFLLWGVLLMVVFIVKNEIIVIMEESIIHHNIDYTIANIVDMNYIGQRILWLFSPRNLNIYIFSLLSKMYYLIISSCGLLIPGIITWIREVRDNYSHLNECKIVEMYYEVALLVMLVTCVIANPGKTEDYKYFFYSRYYMNIALPAIVCATSCYYKRLKQMTEKNLIMLSELICVIITILCAFFSDVVDNNDLQIDICRIPDFSFLSKFTSGLKEMILCGGALMCVLLSLFFLSKKYAYVIVAVCTLFITISNTVINTNELVRINRESYADTLLAEYITKNLDIDEITMVEDYSYRENFYTRMQVLLKDIDVLVIRKESEEITEQDLLTSNGYIMTYASSPLKTSSMLINAIEYSGSRFILYNASSESYVDASLY